MFYSFQVVSGHSLRLFTLLSYDYALIFDFENLLSDAHLHDECLCQVSFQSQKFSINSMNLFVQKCNKHSTGHQGRMQPPLTGAHKNNVSKSNKWQYLRERKNLVDRKMFKFNIHPKLYNRRLKVEILAANTTLSGSLSTDIGDD